jgi:hypothetical protein
LAVTQRNTTHLIAKAHARGSRTRVIVSYIEQPGNVGETDLFQAFWHKAGADSVAVRRLHSASGAIIPVATLMRQRVASTLRRPCVYPWERIVVSPRGTLAFCPADWTHGSTLADYRDITIAELWQSRRYADLRAAHLHNDFRNHAFCGQCPDWQETRWPHEGESYATLVEGLREAS